MGNGLHVPTIYVLSKNMKNVKIFQLKIVIFTAVKNRCMLHGRVSVLRKQNVKENNRLSIKLAYSYGFPISMLKLLYLFVFNI